MDGDKSFDGEPMYIYIHERKRPTVRVELTAFRFRAFEFDALSN